MSPEKWERVCLLVDSLADLPADEQDRRLSAIRDDPAITAEVRRLLDRLGGARGFLSRPVVSLPRILDPESHRLVPGQRVSGRFEVQAFLGAGGMGEVYRVLDTQLQEIVALKTIRAEWAADPQSVERFYREVQMARRVTHENVCRIFDLGQDLDADPPIVFLTMQLVAGGSLRAMLDQGSLPQPHAQALLLDVTRGLTAAHHAGVLHRDLKPGNILIRNSDGTGAVVTDFGLAHDQSGALAGDATTYGQIAGTPMYMAPERLQGEPATAAADVYALGLIMYEALAGRLPFAERPPLGAILMRSRQAPASLKSQEVSALWDTVMRRCLEPDPARRYRDAGEVLDHLNRSSRGWRSQRSRRAFLGTAAGVASFAAAYRYWNWGSLAPHGKVAGNRLLLASWQVPPDRDLQSLEVLMRKTLQQSARLSLWDEERLPSVLQRMGLQTTESLDPAGWRQIALREQVPLVLFTSVSKVGDGYAAALRLEQVNPTTPRTAARYWTRTVEAPNRAGLMDAIREGAHWIRSTMGESASEIATTDRLPQDITTSSWEALGAFARGEKLALHDEAAALIEFETAIRYDPEFTMAWMRKGDILMSVERTADGLTSWMTAINLSTRRPLTVREDLKLRAMFADDSGDLHQSEKLFAEYIHRFPDDFWGYFYRELPLILLGFDEEALAMMNACRRFPDRQSGTLLHLAWDYGGLRDFNRADECVRELAAAGFEERAHWAAGVVAYVRRDHEESLKQLRQAQAISSGSTRSYLRHLEILVLADAGQNSLAVDRTLAYASEDLTSGLRANAASKFNAAAHLLSSESRGRAVEYALKAAEVNNGPVVIAQAGSILARCPRPDLASRVVRLLDGAPDVPRYRVARHRVLGEMALARGRRQEARVHLQAAAAEDIVPYGHEYLARCASLQGDRVAAGAEYAKLATLRKYELRLLYSELPGLTRWAENLHRSDQ